MNSVAKQAVQGNPNAVEEEWRQKRKIASQWFRITGLKRWTAWRFDGQPLVKIKQ